MQRFLPLSALVFVAVVGASCSSSTDVTATFTVPASVTDLKDGSFFDLPFPSDLRLEDGKVRFAGFPNPNHVLILDDYIGYIDKQLDGFSPVAAGFLRFSDGLDPTTLPADPAASIGEGSSVELIDVDPNSPEHGKKRPIQVHFRGPAGVYWPANTLSFMPAVGYPLRPHTKYALLVHDTVTDNAGGAVAQSPTIREMLGIDPASTDTNRAAYDKFATVFSDLRHMGQDLGHIVHFTIFTTNDPTDEYFKAANALPKEVDAPTADPAKWKVQATNATSDEYVGSYGPSPNFQDGKIPFASEGDGGSFKDDDNGVPQVVDTFDLRFSLTVPNATKCPMPTDGYPIVMYAHGTGGDYRSYVSDGTGKSLASNCLATMGVDQIFHGTRPGAPADETQEEILFFNFNNIEAARTNVRQSGLDEVQRQRLFTESHMVVPAAISKTGADIKFDASKLMFFGHSQGSLNGPLFLAASKDVRGAVLSGASGLISITLLEKTQPDPSVANLVKTVFLQLNGDDAKELSIDHPAISLAQSIIDTVDPINYAPRIILDPEAGSAKSIYQTEGIRADRTGDNFAPPRGGEALAMALGLAMQDPFISQPPDAFTAGNITSLPPTMIPSDGLSGNLSMGNATGILAQFDPGDGEGHFVVFDVPAATKQAAGFLKNLADDPKGRVPPLSQ